MEMVCLSKCAAILCPSLMMLMLYVTQGYMETPNKALGCIVLDTVWTKQTPKQNNSYKKQKVIAENI